MIEKRKIRNTDLEVSELGMGTAPIGGWPVAVSFEQAHGKMVFAILIQLPCTDQEWQKSDWESF